MEDLKCQYINLDIIAYEKKKMSVELKKDGGYKVSLYYFGIIGLWVMKKRSNGQNKLKSI